METKRNKGLIFGIAAMVVAVIGTGIAFAALSTTLDLKGTAEVDPASWNVRFKTLSAASTTGAATELTAPTINDTKIENIDIQLTKPGDSISYTFYVENSGSLDAKIGTFTKANNPTCTGTGASATTDASLVCNNLTYSVKYVTEGTDLTVGDILDSGASRQVELKLAYNSNANVLPDNKVEITDLDLSMIYVEK